MLLLSLECLSNTIVVGFEQTHLYYSINNLLDMNHHLSIQNPTTLSYSTMDNNNRTNRHNSPLSVKPPPKIALLFLTNTNHHHPILWKRFLDASPPNRYTIYAHPSCASIALRQSSRATAKKPVRGVRFAKYPCPPNAIPPTSFLYGHTLSNDAREPTKWGKLVLAYYALLKEAVRDPDNQRFVFVSETCVPVVHPNVMYRALTRNLEVTYMDDALDPEEDKERYYGKPVRQRRGERRGERRGGGRPRRRTKHRYRPHRPSHKPTVSRNKSGTPKITRVQRALEASGIHVSHFFKHSGWFCPCRRDALRLLACRRAFEALNDVKAGDEHILSILKREPGFWKDVDNETDPGRKQALIDRIEQWKHNAMHPKTFHRWTAEDTANVKASGCLLVRKVAKGVTVPWGKEWTKWTRRSSANGNRCSA